MTGPPIQLSGSRCIILPSRPPKGLIRHGINQDLAPSLPIRINQDLALRASHRVSSFLESSALTVHQ
jgi:hypothetical protein